MQKLALSAICLAIAVGSAHAQQGGIEVFAGETLFADGFRASTTYIYKQKSRLFQGSSEIGDPQDRRLEDHRFVFGLDHGLHPDVTVSALLPMVHKRFRSSGLSGRTTLDASGLGDVAVLGKWRLYKEDWKRSSFNFAVVGGVEMPTGRTDAADGGMRLSPDLQPGSGSWDPFFATTAVVSLDRFRFDAKLFHKINTEGSQQFEDGDFSSVEIDAAYRFLHEQYPGPSAAVRIGLQWRHEENDEQFGVSLANSGADQLILRPGLGFHPRPDFDIALSVDIPVYQDFDGTQLALDFRIFFAFGVRF